MCAQLDAVSAALSAAPAPPLPGTAEHRVLAALAVEGRSRARHPGACPLPGQVRPRRGLRAVTGSRVLLPAATCLLVLCAGVGYEALSTPQRASRGTAASAAAFSPGTVHAGLAPAGPAGTGAKRRSPGAAGTAGFVVTDTHIRYWRTTLRTQLRDRIAARLTVPSMEPSPPGPAPDAPTVPASATASGPGPGPTGSVPGETVPDSVARPSRSLVGCVMRLTRDTPPEFVDRATYQSEPVYVIAVSGEAWVVGIDCTATRPVLITSVRLTPNR